MSDDGGGLGARLVAAVEAGDAEAVREWLRHGADPETRGPDGSPVLCAAVAAWDGPVAEALVADGADPDRQLPDGTTPLVRAVDGGSVSTVAALLGEDACARLDPPAREALLARARTWYEAGAERELRRRTGASGPAAVVRAPEETYEWVEQITVGGRSVRAGHGGVLSRLERVFGVTVPPDELVARAVARCGQDGFEDHTDWSEASITLGRQGDPESWSLLLDLRRSPSLAHRRLLHDALRIHHWSMWRPRGAQEPPTHRARQAQDARAVLAWAREEPDPDLLAELLNHVCEGWGYGDTEPLGLRHATHAHPKVRAQAAYVMGDAEGLFTPEGTAAVRALLRDPDPWVRVETCDAAQRDPGLRPEVVGTLIALIAGPPGEPRTTAAYRLAFLHSPEPAPDVCDTVFALRDDPDQEIRLNAAAALARRDDPRTPQALERIGPPERELSEYDDRVDAIRRWERESERGKRSYPRTAAGPRP